MLNRLGVIRCVRVCAALAACLVSMAGSVLSDARAAIAPPPETAILLGQMAYRQSAMVVNRGGQIVAAWSTRPGRTYVVRVNAAMTRTTLLATVTGYIVKMAAGPGGSLYLVTQMVPAGYPGGTLAILKLSSSGHTLWTSSIPDNGAYTRISAVATDSSGDVYVAGYTGSDDLGTPGAFQTSRPSPYSGFVRKLSPGGQTLYSTYIGGYVPTDALPGTYAEAIAIDASGDAYVAGETFSTEFPLVKPLQSEPRSLFLAELSPTGDRLLFSTYLGGKTNVDGVGNHYGDHVAALVLGKNGSIFVAGAAVQGFPTTAHAFQPQIRVLNPQLNYFSANGFVMKIGPAHHIAYSTYLGGSTVDTKAVALDPESDAVNAMALDGRGDAIVVGEAGSMDFPLAHPIQARHGNAGCSNGGDDHDQFLCDDGFLSVLNPAGSKLLRSTFIGGRHEDQAFNVALDSSGAAIVEGVTKSVNFPFGSHIPLDASVPICKLAQLQRTRCEQVFIAKIRNVTVR